VARVEDIDDLEEGSEVGEAVLPLTSGLPEGSPVEVTFELNREGRLHITGKDLATGGKTVTATIETNRALSEKELEKATDRARGIKVT
jgi:molecular chaperone DnaK (HSP70)